MATVIGLHGTGGVRFNKKVAEALGFKNFPRGTYQISTESSSSTDDIPWVANFVSSETSSGEGTSKTPSWGVDGHTFLSAYVRKTNGTGTWENVYIRWNDPQCYGIFLPALYDYDVGALMNARDTIISRANLTVVQWLKKV